MRCSQGETVPYIICVKKDEQGVVVASSAALPLAQKAYHIEELQGNAQLAVDAQYYLAHQVNPGSQWSMIVHDSLKALLLVLLCVSAAPAKPCLQALQS